VIGSFRHEQAGARTRIEGLEAAAQERARLAQRLISSLDPKADADVEKLWLQEAERRLRELQSGKIAGIPAEKVIRKARSTLR
jgi:putative addiction module component (TIGR02574 family)